MTLYYNDDECSSHGLLCNSFWWCNQTLLYTLDHLDVNLPCSHRGRFFSCCMCFSNKEFVLNSTCQKGNKIFWFIFSLSNMWQCPLATNSFFSFFPNISDIWLVYILERSRRLRSRWGSLSRCCVTLYCCWIRQTPWRKTNSEIK